MNINSGADMNQIIIFCLDNEFYGVDVLQVQEIVSYMAPCPIPNAPSYFKGVINLRDSIIPIIDLRVKLDFALVNENIENSTIVVVSIKNKKYGLLVDSVSDVVTIEEKDIQETLDVHTEVNGEYVLGVAKNGEQMIVLVDIDNLLKNTDEIDKITNMSKNII